MAANAVILASAVMVWTTLGMPPTNCINSNVAETDMSDDLSLLALRQTRRTLEGLILALPDGASKDLLRSLRVCGACEDFQRFGEIRDGGYLMCMDHLGDVQAAYSMGVEKHDKWSADVQEALKVPVYQMDCTVPTPAQGCPGCVFLSVCLGGDEEHGTSPKPAWTLQQTLEKTGQAAGEERSLIAKIDIEGSEWPALLSSNASTLRKFRQLVVEFHSLHLVEKHAQYLKAMQSLQEAGFRVVHFHGNNFSPTFDMRGYTVPQVIELTLDATAEPMAACLQDQPLLLLDHANTGFSKDTPPIRLPA